MAPSILLGRADVFHVIVRSTSFGGREIVLWQDEAVAIATVKKKNFVISAISESSLT